MIPCMITVIGFKCNVNIYNHLKCCVYVFTSVKRLLCIYMEQRSVNISRYIYIYIYIYINCTFTLICSYVLCINKRIAPQLVFCLSRGGLGTNEGEFFFFFFCHTNFSGINTGIIP